MANNGTFINLENGKLKQNNAIAVSTGAADADKIIKLGPSGKIDVSVLPVGVGPDAKVAEASENLSAGKYVNFWDDAGVEKVRLADASNGRDAHGFVKQAFNAGENATVFFEGPNESLSGLTVAARYYLDIAGNVTLTPRTTGIHQFLGVAIDSNSINTDIDDLVVL